MKFKCCMIGCNSKDTEYYQGRWYCLAHYPKERKQRKAQYKGRDAQ